MPRMVLKLPDGLALKVNEAAKATDKLPTEWVRDLLRRALAEDGSLR